MGSVDCNILGNLPMVDCLIPRLQQCRNERSLALARNVHMHICLHGLDACDALRNHLITTFAECGSMPLAQRIFLGLAHRNEFAWAALMQGYVDSGDFLKATFLYEQMLASDTHPNKFTYSLVLKACSKMKSIVHGQIIHMDIVKQGLQIDSFVGNTLVDMYAKCGFLSRSTEVFDGLSVQNIVAWNALITGYEDNGLLIEALRLFQEMKEAGIVPDRVTSICILRACANLGCIQWGQQVHAEIVQEEYEVDAFVGSILINMYSKCGLLEDAQEVFEELHCRDIVVWTSLIGGYAQNGLVQDVKKCWEQMQSSGIPFTTVVFNAAIMGYAEQGEVDETLLLCSQMKEQGLLPDGITFTCILKACSETAAIETGRSIHAQIQGMGGVKSDEIIVPNALIDMYTKCGSMAEAQNVFDIVFLKDTVSWSTLIAGYAAQGEFDIVLCLTKRMKVEGFKPDGFVCLSIIAACSHAGLVKRGQIYFEDAYRRQSIEAALTHYNCVFDLLVRAGQLAEAFAVVKTFPFELDDVSWSLFLSVCNRLSSKEAASKVYFCVQKLVGRHV